MLIEDGKLQASLCANTVTTVDYLLAGTLGKPAARGHIQRLLKTFDIALVNRRVLQDATESNLSDFEDAVIAESAKASGIQTIITRNGKDFVGFGLHVYSPSQWLAGYATKLIAACACIYCATSTFRSNFERLMLKNAFTLRTFASRVESRWLRTK